jgi:thiosulfate dehydrogenase (quinone) large subunit
MSYIEKVKSELKDWKAAALVIVFTVARIIYGWGWVEAGLHKLAWFSDGKLNSAGLIQKMVNNLVGPEVHGFDPLHINNLFAAIAKSVFLGMPGVTDGLVVIFEIGIGIFMILGIQLFWTALVALFMNIQFITSGSANNFGYIWTNIAVMQFAKYAELIGVSGYLKSRKSDKLLAKQAAK